MIHDHATHLTVSTTTEGIITTISPAVALVLGWEPGEVLGHTLFEFLHPDDVSVGRRAQHDLNAGRAVQLIVRIRVKHGDHRWVVGTMTPVVDTRGAVVGVSGSVCHLAAERRLAHALQRREFPLRRVIDGAAGAMVHTTGELITWVSASVERLTGWYSGEAIDTLISHRVHPIERRAVRQMRAAQRFEQADVARFRAPCGNGSAEAVSALRGITGGIEAERARDRVEHRLAVTLDTMFDPHSYLRPVHDDTGRVIDLEFVKVNEALCRYLRRERHEVEGHLVSELLPRQLQGGLVARVHEVLDTGQSFVAEGLRSWNDLLGEYRLYDITVIPVDDVVSMWHRDVTERYAQFHDEARLRSLEVLHAERERLARDLHDGAIQKVFATSMQLAALAAQLPGAHRQRLEQLIDLQDAVIRDLRTTVYQLGTTGRGTMSPERAIHGTTTEAARVLGFEPRLTVDPDITTLDESTLGHLLLVLRETLSNVARHAHAHSVEVDVKIIGSDVVLDVWDDGVGLPNPPTHGNGLRNLRRRAQLLGGDCEVVSGPGEGTEVIWRVPAHAA